jgi:glycosyltransferase involved in cell wall biosynthesis
MNVVLLHYSAPPVVGGVESVLGHHARLMADAGHRVRVVAGRGAAADPRIEFALQPLVGSLHPDVLAVKAELDRGLLPAGFSGLVARLEGSLHPLLSQAEVVIAHNVCSLHKNLALTAALRNLAVAADGPRWILWHHDLAWTTPRYRSELHPGYPWDLLRTPLEGARQVVVSEARHQELVKLLGLREDEVTVVPNGIDAPRFLKLGPETLGLLAQLDLEQAAPILLLPVRLTPRKNIELALRMLACLREAHPAAALVVTGPQGPHNPSNREYVMGLQRLRHELALEGAAYFLAELSDHFLPDEVIADFYRLADALFLPSREEGFGIPMLEAGLAGLPIFCADIPPLRQLGGDAAEYFSPDADPQAVADVVSRHLARDPRYRLRRRVRETYSWESIYRQRIAPLLTSQETA